MRWQVRLGRPPSPTSSAARTSASAATFRAQLDEVLAFEHLGEPYFRAGQGCNVVGLLLDDNTDWDEVAELLTYSYCIQAPHHLAAEVPWPPLNRVTHG